MHKIDFIKGTCFLFSIVLTLSTTAQSPSMAQSKRELPTPPGKLIDLGGYKLHLNCSGSGTPTILLESGFGGWSLDWEKVQPLASDISRVCSYDRAGLGWSDPSQNAPTSKQIAQNLHQALSLAGEPSPFILVGHSLGGLHVRMFASLYPRATIGMLLLDASHEDQFGWERNTYWKPPVPDPLPPQKQMPDIIRSKEKADLVDKIQQSEQWQQTVQREGQAIGESINQLRGADPLPDVALIVMSAGPRKNIGEYWNERELEHNQMQNKLTGLAPRSSQMYVEDSDHYIQLDRPDLVIDAFEELVTYARSLAIVSD